MTAGRQAEGAGTDHASARLPSRVAKLLSALFYGTCSFLLVLVNKALLTTYRFPSPIVLGIGQMAVTIMILYVSKLNKVIHFPDFDKKIPIKLADVHRAQEIYHSTYFTPGNHHTRETVFLEHHCQCLCHHSWCFHSSWASFYVLRSPAVNKTENNPCLHGAFIQELGKYGVLFYNACFMIIPTLIISVSTGDLRQATEFNQWKNVLFIIQFLLSCFLGFLLMYSTLLCSYYNSALTTAVVGAIKNVSVAYIGMLVGGDYIFSVLNFVGLNICMAGGLRYSFLTLNSQLKPKQPVDEENIPQDLKG
ncbi:nucleotide sugar transporter SLC35D2 isoform X3 [Lagenorhynchus albirostris]|uniref:nucleotide sugar transporter SLC35D2 isoform X3 n=1 Tax=Lagenorhynchus albirostris TaxID=27610 RepID=UPI0028E23AA2|nr:nucleotide sugar transporter SLC35D2 isoform X3 [Lagenorhynchus albirostris]